MSSKSNSLRIYSEDPAKHSNTDALHSLVKLESKRLAEEEKP